MIRTASRASLLGLKLQILAILLWLPMVALAQTTPVAATAATQDLKYQQLTAKDTIQAIHNLFKSRRTGGVVMATSAIGGDLILAGMAAASEAKQNSGFEFGFGFHAFLIGIVAAPLAVSGIRKRLYFSHKREERVVDEYTTKHQLPRAVQRRLLPRFFNQSADN